jgi:hypothetical protein
MFSGTAQVSDQVCQFFGQFCVSSCACDCGGYCLIATSAITLTEKKKRKRKMWIKKWYLKRNMSCDVHVVSELLETDDTIVVSAGKLGKLWDSLSELRRFLCDLRPAPLPVTTASGMTSQQIAQFESV